MPGPDRLPRLVVAADHELSEGDVPARVRGTLARDEVPPAAVLREALGHESSGIDSRTHLPPGGGT